MPKIGTLGIWELLILLVVVLLLFGPRRLPEMAKGLGQSVREFRKGLRDMRSDIDEELSVEQKKAQAAAAAPVAAATTTAEAAPNSSSGADQAADKA